MPRSDVSDPELPGDVLTVLRVVGGWSQKQLAASAGLSPKEVSAYERGTLALRVSALRRLLAVMSLPSPLLERTLSFLAEARAMATLAAGGAGGELGEGLGMDVEAVAIEFGQSYESFARSALARFLSQARILQARRRAPELWARLRPYPPRERLARVRETAEFQDVALCELVCRESERAAADHPGPALALAELAVEIAGLVPGSDGRRRRCQGYARAFLANARRVAGSLAAADAELARAKELWKSGAPADASPLDPTRLLDQEAALRLDQRRLPEALALLDRALAVHAGGNAAARLLMMRAKTLEELDDYQGAISCLRRAAPLIDAQEEPRFALVLRFNWAYDLCHVGHAAEAERLLPEVRALALDLGNRLDLVRLRGLEAIVASGLGRTEEAIALLHQVRADFVELALLYDAALITLELAVLYAAEGRTAEVKILARQAAPILRAEGVHPEARRALALFQRAAQEERLTLALARRLLAYLERARREPTLRFEPA